MAQRSMAGYTTGVGQIMASRVEGKHPNPLPNLVIGSGLGGAFIALLVQRHGVAVDNGVGRSRRPRRRGRRTSAGNVLRRRRRRPRSRVFADARRSSRRSRRRPRRRSGVIRRVHRRVEAESLPRVQALTFQAFGRGQENAGAR